MYRNDGGDEIVAALSAALAQRGHTVVDNCDLPRCIVMNGQVFNPDGVNLSELDLLYHMNVDEQTEHQMEVLGAVERSGVTLVNAFQSFMKARDKFVTNQLLRQAGLSVPASALVPTHTLGPVRKLFDQWGKLLVKSRFGHGGKAIALFENYEQFVDFSHFTASSVPNYYLEQFIHFGEHDYRVELLDGQVIGGYARTRTHLFKTNVSAGGKMTPMPPSHEHQELARAAAATLGITTTIVDIIRCVDSGQDYITEVNHIMGIFVEAGMRRSPKSVVKAIDPSFAYDQRKLQMLTDYLAATAERASRARARAQREPT
jgi:ribosomal protein S6--L-glutamate ligase